MSLKRFAIEFGAGVDLHGEDVTNAAKKAVVDAISKTDLCGLVEILNIKDLDDITIDVLIASPFPDDVDVEAVAKVVPMGKKRVNVVNGGMIAPGLYLKRFGETNRIIVAVACVTVAVDMEKINLESQTS